MRRLACLLLALLFLPAVCPAGAEGTRGLTVMVYMCGSNLESAYGSASADIREMLDSGFGGGDTALLVMTGGSGRWLTGYNPDETAIHEIRGGRQRTVFREEKRNMGEKETLAMFLSYARENYPAEDYALILWDHGGGPVEGACWDELFSPDNLSLEELAEALKEAGLKKKLKWIGFDACLMSSLEVAGALAPCADYMIASQETEPAAGWNYSFLSQITSETSGAETGRLIVDAFFEGRENETDVLTLACTDLEKAAEAADAIGAVFSPYRESISEDQFRLLTDLRMSAVSYGSPVRGLGDDGYDLVDARDLVSRFGGNPEARDEALRLLREAVVYSRFLNTEAGGLSLYHPAVNKEKYLAKWRDAYHKLGFSEAYTRYTETYGAMLTGIGMVRWDHLLTENDGTDESGNERFSLRLTDAQTANLVSARLLIIRDTISDQQLGKNCVLVSSGEAAQDGQGTLSAVYGGRTLYAETESGKLTGPLSFILTEDGHYVVTCLYVREGDYNLSDYDIVLYYLDGEKTEEYPDIVRTRVWDEMTGSYTGRLAFSEENYRTLMFWNRNRAYPGEGAEESLPAFSDWADGDAVNSLGFGLPEKWHFRFIDGQPDGSQLYAMFEMTDMQQNTVCSVPVPVGNPELTPFSAEPEEAQTDEFIPGLSGSVRRSEQKKGVLFAFEFTNPLDTEMTVSFDSVLLNGNRLVPLYLRETVPPGGTVRKETEIGPEQTAFLDRVETLAFTARWERADGEGEKKEIPVQFRVDGARTAGLFEENEPLAEKTEDGLTFRLLRIEPDSVEGCNLILYAENTAGQAVQVREALIDCVQTGTYGSAVLQPGTSQVMTLRVNNDERVDSTLMGIAGEESMIYDIVLAEDLRESYGKEQIGEIELILKPDDGSTEGKTLFRLPMKQPAEVPKTQAQEMVLWKVIGLPDGFSIPEELPVLTENNQYCIRLRSLCVGREGAAFCLDIENRTDRFLMIEEKDGKINGEAAKHLFFSGFSGTVAPGTVRILPMILADAIGTEQNPDAEPREVQSFSFVLKSEEQEKAEAVEIRLKIPVMMGTDGGVWLTGSDLEIRAAEAEDVEYMEGAAYALEPEILIPENAESFREWITAPLDSSQLAAFSGGTFAIVRKTESGTLQVVQIQGMKKNEEGKAGADYSGLVACVAGSPQLYWLNLKQQAEEGHLGGKLFSNAEIFSSRTLTSYYVFNVRYDVDYAANTAAITAAETDGEPFTDWEDMSTVTVYTYEVTPEYDGDGRLKHFDELPMRNDFEWYMNAPGAYLNSHPAQITLRPIAEEDQMYILFSIRNEDGSGYSLPLIPWEERAQ